MTEQQKKEPKEPLHIPLDFDEVLSDLLKVKPPPEHKKRQGAAKKSDKKEK